MGLATFWHTVLSFFSEKYFPTLAALTSVSNVTSTTIPCAALQHQNFAIFCNNYFEDLVAFITFAKNFGFLAGVVSETFVIENALQSKTQFLHNPCGKSYLLCHRTLTIAHKNLILEIASPTCGMQIQCF